MKETTITIETTSLLILRTGNSRVMWCPVCEAEVEMFELSTRETSALDQLPRDLHQSAAPDGAALICLNSLLVRVQNAKSADRGTPRLPNTEKEGI